MEQYDRASHMFIRSRKRGDHLYL
jgi:hypothetical protein